MAKKPGNRIRGAGKRSKSGGKFAPKSSPGKSKSKK